MNLPELLAPAGSPETFFAGFEAGADAFYLGAPDFNARKRAKNFTRDEIEQAVAFAHQHEKKIYITLNTLVYDTEIPALTDLLCFLDRAQVDAVILQDLGVLELIRKHFPKLQMHASTQTFCHNSMQAQFLKDAGVSRIILPRELSLEEIRAIKAAVPLEYELFIHGALCFSFSGCCLFSSFHSGASGNRGECRQLCRHAFETKVGRLYPFAMKDLNGAPLLEKILEAHPTSLKIEGRLKNADYVSQTVSFYRRLLDAYAETGRVPAPGAMPTGQRVFSTGYFDGKADYETLVTPHAPGAFGERIGTCRIARNGTVVMLVKRPLAKGARLRVADAKGRAVCDGTLLSFSSRPRGKETEITWRLQDAQAAPGDLTVLLLGTYQPKDPHKSFRHALSQAKPLTLRLSLIWKENRLEVAGRLDDARTAFSHTVDLALEPARQQGNADALRTKLEEVFHEAGGLPFGVRLEKITIPSAMFCPVSALKKIRREVFEMWAQKLETDRREKEAAVKSAVVGELETIQAGPVLSSPQLFTASQPFALPLFIAEHKVPQWKQRLELLATQKPSTFVASGYGWIPFLTKLPGAEVFSGPYVYCVNSFAYQFLKGFGIKGCLLAVDVDDKTLGPLALLPGSFRLADPVKEVFVTRLRIPQDEYRLKGKCYSPEHCEDYDLLKDV